MTEYYGKYRATVTDATDPMTSGRLQVDVPATGATGVWAEASLPPIPQSFLRLPGVGSTVWVEFEEGDVDRPIWTGATWGTDPGGDVTLESEGRLTIRAATVDVVAAMTEYTGVLKSDQLITNSVVSASYTPGAGNLQ